MKILSLDTSLLYYRYVHFVITIDLLTLVLKIEFERERRLSFLPFSTKIKKFWLYILSDAGLIIN